MGSSKSRYFFTPFDSTMIFNSIATPYGSPIAAGLTPLAMPFNLPWGMAQTIGTEFGLRYCVIGG